MGRFQLHYLSDERRFLLIEKGKLESKNRFQIFRGKPGKKTHDIQSDWYSLNFVDKFSHFVYLNKIPHNDLFCCYKLNRVAESISNSILKCFFHYLFCVYSNNIKLQDDLDIIGQNLIVVSHKELSRGKLNLFDLECYVNSLILCMKILRISLSIRGKFESFDCLYIHVPKSYLFNICELLLNKKFSLHSKTSDQNHVFKPGVCFSRLLL